MSINRDLFSILQSPDDHTPIGPDLRSEGGLAYEATPEGILMLASRRPTPAAAVYASEMFSRWNGLLQDRIDYYTKKRSIAGRLANASYRRIRQFNVRPQSAWLLDIGCGDGAQAEDLSDRRNYVGLDRNLARLRIFKQRYPEATAIHGDASALPFRSGSVSYVYSSNTFEHLWYLKDAIMDLCRVTAEDAQIRIIVPTEGGLWNLGRQLLSRPRFMKKYPDIDFDFISHVEHCNNARQIRRTLETFFEVRTSYWPTRVPTVMVNVLVEYNCRHRRPSPMD